MMARPGIDLLLVEDNPQDAEMILRVFQKSNLSYRVLVLEDGAAALEFIFEQATSAQGGEEALPKAIFLDIKLPKVDGMEVLQRMKSDGRTKSVPTIMLTSSREESDLRRAYQLGANSYVVKPMSYSAFVDCLAKLGTYWLHVNESPPMSDRSRSLPKEGAAGIPPAKPRHRGWFFRG
jgi:two-component system, response regulator